MFSAFWYGFLHVSGCQPWDSEVMGYANSTWMKFILAPWAQNWVVAVSVSLYFLLSVIMQKYHTHILLQYIVTIIICILYIYIYIWPAVNKVKKCHELGTQLLRLANQSIIWTVTIALFFAPKMMELWQLMSKWLVSWWFWGFPSKFSFYKRRPLSYFMGI